MHWSWLGSRRPLPLAPHHYAAADTGLGSTARRLRGASPSCGPLAMSSRCNLVLGAAFMHGSDIETFAVLQKPCNRR